MSKSRNLKEEWIPCPPGTLPSLAGNERSRQRRQFLVRAGSTAGAIALATGAGWMALQKEEPFEDPVYSGIACSQVRELAPQMMMGKLEAKQADQIMAHVEQCDECRALIESMQSKSVKMSHVESGTACKCSTCRRESLTIALGETAPPLPIPIA
ncbi:zf-HC2 domain-containing protein [Rubinisphaera italica]|uniref:Putative zinc-finger domain-containing protein n=1 Tax=Rubinisphaera italica TaxID=2527969 RepID=A0A5C5XNR6_9PLAN|nr:zf-HC2 domain-containing protein [Rubinisphaera italica]TWT64023.1 hypothetical protein Pan54_47830 [Rubinisphaera italica]